MLSTTSSSTPRHLVSHGVHSHTVGVASLDTLQQQQTKLDIRNLVSQIAELAASHVRLSEFLDGSLPRICQAMGAQSAALWQLDLDGSCRLLGSHQLPAELNDATINQSHQNVIACAAHEGSPVLVPPSTTRLSTPRPANPLPDALLLVPIKLHDRVEALLEVIQSQSGGPAAQRGYLRFVAQMADLVGDFLRRAKLAELTQRAEYTAKLHSHLLAIEAAPLPARAQAIANALSDLLESDLCILLVRDRIWSQFMSPHRWQLKAVSHVPQVDSRSQIAVAAQQWLEQMRRHSDQLRHGRRKKHVVSQLAVSEPHDPPEHQEDNVLDESDLTTPWSTMASGVTELQTDPQQQLMQLLGTDHGARIALSHDGRVQAILSFANEAALVTASNRASELIPTFRSICAIAISSGSQSIAFAEPNSQKRWKAVLERIVVRTSTVLLCVAVALFPVPDHIQATAILEAAQKDLYYAPTNTTVAKVLVESGQMVEAGQPLLELADPQLLARRDELEGQRITTELQIDQDRAALLRGQLAGRSAEEIEGRLEQLKINLRAINDQLAIVRQQSNELTIRARHRAQVTTWDLRNRLMNRPVAVGQLLLTAAAPEAAWQINLSIPQRQAGYVQDALQKSGQGLPIQYSLSSHPHQVQTGRLVSLSKQLMHQPDGSSSVMAQVQVDATTLPAKTDGAIARAAIDCGRTYAGWLLVRDAYRQTSAWWQLNW